MRSAVQHQFSMVPSVDIPRSRFDRTHGHKTTFQADYLVPFYVDEVLPGDTFNARATIFARMATPLFPIMDNLRLDTFYFFVPNRLVWDNWQRFMGEKPNPDDDTEYTVPVMTADTVEEGSLWDHFGLALPMSVSVIEADEISALPFRAYNLIWNEWFRDQNLQDSVTVDKGDAASDLADYQLLKRCKKHDYFTSATTQPQKGDPVSIPIGVGAPVYGTGKSLALVDNVGSGATKFGIGYESLYHCVSPITQAYTEAPGTTITGGTRPTDVRVMGVAAKDQVATAQNSGLYADLSSATAATINSLRQAFQLQRMLERDMRGGTRYIEIIKSHFGVQAPDYRLQRPEYLGGSSQLININPVQQTAQKSSTDATQTPLGTVGGFGVGHTQSGFSKSFVEHGWVIGLVCVRGDITYQQGINRMFTRQTKYDYYWPALAHLGEQEIYQREIYSQLSGFAADKNVWAYQERYAEYRYYPSVITSAMRSMAAAPLDAWHLAEEFAGAPSLNDVFIKANTPMSRVLAVPGTEQSPKPHFIMDSLIQLSCARPMPVFSVPGLIDHF